MRGVKATESPESNDPTSALLFYGQAVELSGIALLF